MRTIESLVVKFCQGGLEGTVQPAFIKFLEALFQGHEYADYSCIEAAAHYLLAYNQAIMTAQLDFLIDGTFQVETSSPCDIAKLAGLYQSKDEQPVYPPNAERIAGICSDNDSPAHALSLIHI